MVLAVKQRYYMVEAVEAADCGPRSTNPPLDVAIDSHAPLWRFCGRLGTDTTALQFSRAFTLQ